MIQGATKTYDTKVVEEMLQTRRGRLALFENNLLLFALYYFSHYFTHKMGRFQLEWLESLEGDNNTYIKAFRESGKTVYVVIFIIWAICFKKYRFIQYYAYEKDKAVANIFGLVNELILNRKLIDDFGYLYPRAVSKKEKEELQKKSIKEFITTNGVKVKARSIGESPRGDLFIYPGEGAFRPDCVIMDDIDVDKSVSSVKVIDKNYYFLKREVIGGLKGSPKIVLLGNTIKQDGICPRFENDYKSSAKWDIFIQAVYDRDGKIVWSRITEKQLQDKRELEGEIAFAQNFLLVPYVDGDTIFKREDIQQVDTYPEDLRMRVGIDPSFSFKTNSDPMGVTLQGYKDVTDEARHRYIIQSWEMNGKDKDLDTFVDLMVDIYEAYPQIEIFLIEGNNGGEIIAREMQKRGLPVEVVNTDRDKVTRAREKQGSFARGYWFFLPGTEKTQEQLLHFPNVAHDDLVDSVLISDTDYLTVTAF